MLVSKGTTLGNALRRSLIQHTRWSHSTAALPAPLERVMDLSKTGWGNKEEIEAPHFSDGVGPMVLMAVPKKKVSPYKRGLRNGPKALKPVPVIVRCKSCGRVKLPHFYCCSGDRGSSQGKDSSS